MNIVITEGKGEGASKTRHIGLLVAELVVQNRLVRVITILMSFAIAQLHISL